MSLTEKIKGYCSNLLKPTLVAGGLLASLYSADILNNSIMPEVRARDSEEQTSYEGEEETGLKEYQEFVHSAFDGKYDNHNSFCKDSLENILDTTHKIFGHITYEVTRYDYSGPKTKKDVSEHTLVGIGSCVAIKNDGRYLTLLTANHVVDPPNIKDKYDDKQRPLVTFKIKEVNYILEQEDLFVPIVALPFVGSQRLSVGPEIEVIARDKEHDLAVMRTKKGFEETVAGYNTAKKWGNSEELEPGDFIYSLGFPHNITKQAVSGHVSAKDNPFNREDDYLFIVDAMINTGNSGGPVYALRDGKPELVGIVHSKWPEGIGGIIRIEYAKKLLKSIRLGDIFGDAK